jgi:hypothetical protein
MSLEMRAQATVLQGGLVAHRRVRGLLAVPARGAAARTQTVGLDSDVDREVRSGDVTHSLFEAGPHPLHLQEIVEWLVFWAVAWLGYEARTRSVDGPRGGYDRSASRASRPACLA